MSTNSANVEDAEMPECDGEKVVTMMDVLQEQQEFEDDANAVLGASDDKNCTYNKGYIKRQAVYACLTCCSDAKLDPSKRAGVCLACSLTCHENHDLVELYTKRNFCCDCGNPKFNHPCQYTSNKSNLNDDNIYNQNFSGLYCTCHRPYPDPDGDEEEMIQCIVCEDWLHASHLEATVPSSELFAEMICKACMEKNEFLHDYGKYAVNDDGDVVDISDIIDSAKHCNGDKNEENGVDVKTESNASDEINVIDKINTEKISNETSTEAKNTNHDDVVENKSEEQEQPKDSISERTDVEIPAEDNKAKNKVSGKADEENSTENNQAKDTNEILKSDEISHDKLGENLNATASSIDQEYLKDAPVVLSESKEESTGDDNKEPIHVTTDANMIEQQVENPTDISQEPIGCDAGGEQQTEQIQTDTEFKVDSQEKQGDPADSTLTSAADKIEEIDGKLLVTAKHTIGNKETKDSKRKLSTEASSDDISVKKTKLSGSTCLRRQGEKKVFKGATFWPTYFRQKLCTCTECITMYKDMSVLFLIDPEDTVTAYEALGKEKTNGTASTQYEKGLEALSSLGRIQQINALTEYNKMRDKLLDFLKSFKDRKEIVKEEDIKAFFAGMKPKREPDGVYFCR